LKTDNREPNNGEQHSVDRFFIVGCPFFIGCFDRSLAQEIVAPDNRPLAAEGTGP
jgi:hypothetical protein